MNNHGATAQSIKHNCQTNFPILSIYQLHNNIVPGNGICLTLH